MIECFDDLKDQLERRNISIHEAYRVCKVLGADLKDDKVCRPFNDGSVTKVILSKYITCRMWMGTMLMMMMK